MTIFDPPLDPNVSCERCGAWLVVTGVSHERPNDPTGYDPMYGHVWTHKHGSPDCRIINGAKPNSYARPAESIQHAIMALHEAEDNAADDAEFPNAAYRKFAGPAAYAGMPDWQRSEDNDLIKRVIKRRMAQEKETP